MRCTLISAAPVLFLALAMTGCGPTGSVKEESIEVKPNPAIDQAKHLLNNYAKGQKLGSEVTSFDTIVADVRKTDPPKASVLEKGFAELQKPKVDTKAKAKEILAQLAPRTGGD